MKYFIFILTLSIFSMDAKSQCNCCSLPMDSGIVACYPFNGNTNDLSGNANNGTGSAIVAAADRFGNPNSAYYFNGSTSIITVPASPTLRPLNRISISVWVRPEPKPVSPPTWNFIVVCRRDNASAPYNSYNLSTHPSSPYNNKWTMSLSSTNNSFDNELVGKYVKTDYAWQHVVATYDGINMKIYTNGKLDTSRAINIPSFLYTNAGINIGNHNAGPSVGFLGTMDDLRIYNRALTSNEVRILAGLAPITTYYTKSTGSINQLSTWGTNTDGSGTSPLSFDSSNTIYNVVNGNTSLTGNFKVNGANSLVVFGDGSGAVTFPIASTDSLSADSVYINNSVTLTVSGTLQSTKLGAGTSSSVQYIGSNPQVLAAGTYENMIVSASTKTALGNITVKGILGMLASINCGTYELTLGVNTTTRGTLNRSTGSIIGRFSRWYTNATNSGTTGLYPIGTATKYNPIQLEFTTAPTTGGKITCEFIAGTPGNGGLPQYDFSNGIVYVDKAAVDGVVRYTSIGITGGSYTATYTANNYVGVSNYTNLRVLSRSIAGNWTLVGNAGTNTGTNTAAVIARTGLTSLSGEFGIGGDQSENPLPVKLTAFSAQLSGDASTRLKWQTAFEYNAAKFIIQRSTDKTKWINRGEVKSQRNATTTTNYTFNDEVNGLSNTVYYRLLQVDLDGVSTASKVVSVVLAKQVTTALHVYPNPVNDKLIVSGLVGSAHVYDITGKHQLEITADGEVNITHLPAGIYFLRTETEVIKLVKH